MTPSKALEVCPHSRELLTQWQTGKQWKTQSQTDEHLIVSWTKSHVEIEHVVTWFKKKMELWVAAVWADQGQELEQDRAIDFRPVRVLQAIISSGITSTSRPFALSPTPSFTSTAWRWRACGLHLDTHKSVQVFTFPHINAGAHHTKVWVLNSALEDLGRRRRQTRSLAIDSQSALLSAASLEEKPSHLQFSLMYYVLFHIML